MKNIFFILFSLAVIFISIYLGISNNVPLFAENFETSKNLPQGVLELCSATTIDSSCYDISYIDPTSYITVSGRAKIDPNYYIQSDGTLAAIPNGYIQAPGKRSYIPKTQTAIYSQSQLNVKNDEIDRKIASLTDTNYDRNSFSSKQQQIDYLLSQKMSAGEINKTSNKLYNSDNYDITYHDEPSGKDEGDAGVGKMWIRSKSGELVSVPYSDVKNRTLYYEPGSYRFGPSSYVPNYAESVYLSKLTNEPTTSIVHDFSSQKSGFCKSTMHSMIEREQKCNQLDTSECAATNCCVLLGGEKCVAGNKYGPSVKNNYSDFLLTNRDYYYYNGTCYGNCS